MENNLKFASYKTSIQAKESGFDLPIENYYSSKTHKGKYYVCDSCDYRTEVLATSNWNNGQGSYPTNAKDVSRSAPTLDELKQWMIDVHGLYCNVNVFGYNDIKLSHYESRNDMLVKLNNSNIVGDSMVERYNNSYEQCIYLGLTYIESLIEFGKI